MNRPTFFRDPIHGQIRYEGVDLSTPYTDLTNTDKQLSWLIRRLIDAGEFQRLRHIRQNGLANLVFHGAEHSRFSHSMGVAYLAREMYVRIVQNMGEQIDSSELVTTCAAALLHDVGHGPFSHTIEEILRQFNIPFDHEVLTRRIIEEDTSVNACLQSADPAFPSMVVKFIDKEERDGDKWYYKLVSSQLDADRLDYLLRDKTFAGLQGHGFDLPRLLDLLMHEGENRIAVHERALEAVEAYLMTLDQMYRAVYFHHAIRSATVLLTKTLHRAFRLHLDGDLSVFPANLASGEHPLSTLIRTGQDVPIDSYQRLGEFQVWMLIDEWKFHRDPILSRLASMMLGRRLFKTIEVNAQETRKLKEFMQEASGFVCKALGVQGDDSEYFIDIDESTRTSYKRYDWAAEAPDESIWIIRDHGKPLPIEEHEDSKIITALKTKRYFNRVVFPAETKDEIYALAKRLKVGGK